MAKARSKTITESVTETAAGAIKMPVTFKEFSKNPIVGTLFIVLIAIGYLYIDIRSTFQGSIQKNDVRIEKLEQRVDLVQDALRRSDSSNAVSATQLKTLQQLGKIQEIK
jgi:hypothetical protein